MWGGRAVTKHVTKIIVTSSPLVMTQPARAGREAEPQIISNLLALAVF